MALGLIAAACGGGDTAEVASLELSEGNAASDVAALGDTQAPAGGPEADPADIDTEQALLNLAECMRESGVEMDDPEIDADGNFRLGAIIRQASNADPDDIRAALDECSEHLEGVTLGFRDFDITELQDQMVEFAACMRENGFDMPDPDFSNFAARGGRIGGGNAAGPFGDIDPQDPQFQESFEECQDVLSFGRFGGGGPGNGGRG